MTVCSTLTSHPHSSLLLDANEHEALALVNPQLGRPCCLSASKCYFVLRLPYLIRKEVEI